MYTGSTAGMVLLVDAAGPIKFSTSSAEKMRIDSSGNVGIGTSSPTQKLTVNGSIDLPTINSYIYAVTSHLDR
jgi:hypothetical protein